ncbi:Uncharacterised protein [Mycobacteroides abscessus subsp. massiliense]|nr:Uncharacterised protein [Mycobacteroides abscessus subsp. massiliense]
MLPGTSNSEAKRTGLPVCATSSATSVSAFAERTAANLAKTLERSTGVDEAQAGPAARAAATAASTSAAVASFRSSVHNQARGQHDTTTVAGR